MKKISFLLLTFLLLFSTITYSKNKKDTLVVAQNAQVKTLDPMASNDVPSHRAQLNIYDTLVYRGPNGTVIPGLAHSWKYLDSCTLEMYLRKGIKFHNGEELKADDVVFTLLRAKESPSIMTYFSEIDTVIAVDDYTVQIKTKEPFGPFIMYLAHQGVGILNKKAVLEAGDNYSYNPIGTGPYSFVSWKMGDKIVLKANHDYYRGAPKTENLIIFAITEGSSRTIALETGEIDIAYDVDPIDLSLIQDNKRLKLYQGSSSSIHYIGFNTSRTPFNIKEVRQAIAYAIDGQSMIDIAYLGAATVANSPVPPNTFGYDKDIKQYEKNIEKAKELLKNAGYPNGFKAKIWLNDNTIRRDIAIILQDQLKEIGIDLEIQIMEWGAYLDRLYNSEHDMFILGWSSNPDSDAALYSIYHSKKGSSNYSFFKNDIVDNYLDSGRQSTNPQERKEIYKKLQQILKDEIPMYILAYPDTIVGTRKNIENFVLDPQGEHILYNVSKK